MKAKLILWIVVVAIVGGNGAAWSKSDIENYDLRRASVTDYALLSVLENYYDPDRIDPRAMFEAALDYLQMEIAELTYISDDDKKTIRVALPQESLTFEFSEIDSPWKVSRTLTRVYRLIVEHHRGEIEAYRLEIGVANALLSALDPHSNALPPDFYDDLQSNTRGEFGGLGVQITTDRRPPCDGRLTVVDVLEETPAQRVGLKPGDQILKIDGSSTANITTSEAADRMRGKPGTVIELQVKRVDGKKEMIKIVRGVIPIKSVKYKMLEDNVGYIELSGFQSNSSSEFSQALYDLRQQGMKGLVFDMRSNPGGLLPAAIELADKFISSGTLVATASKNTEDREVVGATYDDTEPLYPMVVLIDGNSASASELLAGSLRHHGRALLVGATTFGKGSVQTVGSLPLGGGLKMTSAQYLLPGDVSIQSVGVAPDVRFVSRSVLPDDVDLDDNHRRFSEADLDKHLDRFVERSRNDRAAALESEVFVPSKERLADRKRYERCFIDRPDWEPFIVKHQLEFARQVVARATGTTAEELLVTAREILDVENSASELDLVRALKKYGVDWSVQAAKGAPNAEPAVDKRITSNAKVIGKIKPGGKLKLKVTVRNDSDETIQRLRAVTKSDNDVLDGHELVFGKVGPGRSRSWTAKIMLPEVMTARSDPVNIKFRSDAGPLPADLAVDVELPQHDAPLFAWGWHLEDLGNSDGVVQPGEDVLLTVALTNVGDRETRDAELRLAGKSGIDIERARFQVGRLRPGASVRAEFKFHLNERFSREEAIVDLTIDDWFKSPIPYQYTVSSHELKIPVAKIGPPVSEAFGDRVARDESAKAIYLRQRPDNGSHAVMEVGNGQMLPIDGRSGSFFRVKLNDSKHAWIAESQSGPPIGKNKKVPGLVPLESRPPVIEIASGDALRTQGSEIVIQGVASHDRGVQDLMVFQGKRKIHYLSSESGQLAGQLAFSVSLKLDEGSNRVTVVARHTDELTSRRTIIVRREPAEDSQKQPL